MTGVWTVPDRYGHIDCLGYGQLVRLGPGQDGAVEADFLAAHLPFAAGSIHGVGPDGEPWVYLIQVMPRDGAKLVATDNPYWPMVDALERSLRFNFGAQTVAWADQGWTREDLVEIYEHAGVPRDRTASWSMSELIKGLMAECCYVPLAQVADGYSSRCAFPNRDHECQSDVFADVFMLWTTGQLNAPEQATQRPDDDDEDSQDHHRAPRRLPPIQTRFAWRKKKLRRWKTLRLRLVAVEEGWTVKEATRMTRRQLIRALSTPHRRPVHPRAVRASKS